jgi:hypothetical protein
MNDREIKKYIHLFRGWKRENLSSPKRITALCKTYTQLNKKQNELCVKYPDLMEPIIRGATTGVKECERQLSTNRWNCSNVPAQGTLFGPVLPVGMLSFSLFIFNLFEFIRNLF